MIVLLTLTTAGLNTGPFDLYSNLDYVIPFETGVIKSELIAGYLTQVPDYTTIVRVQSIIDCTNYVDITLSGTTTTTSSTSSSTTTTTSTTSAPVAVRRVRVLDCITNAYSTINYIASQDALYVEGQFYQVIRSADPTTIICSEIIDKNYVTTTPVDAGFYSLTPVSGCSDVGCNIPNPGPPPSSM